MRVKYKSYLTGSSRTFYNIKKLTITPYKESLAVDLKMIQADASKSPIVIKKNVELISVKEDVDYD